MLQDAQVFERALANQFEQGPDTGFMDLAADEVGLGQQARNVRGGVPHAKTDFKHQGGRAAKDGLGIQRLGLVGQDKLGAVQLKGLGLTQGCAARTFDKTFDGAAKRNFRRWQVLWRVEGVGHAPILEALAGVEARSPFLAPAPQGFAQGAGRAGLTVPFHPGQAQ